MTESKFNEKWISILPLVTAIAARIDASHPRNSLTDVVSSYARRARREAIRSAHERVEDHLGRAFFRAETNAIEYYNAAELVCHWYRAARYTQCVRPEVEATIQPPTMPILRVDAPAWYEDEGFLLWLNGRGTATWHIAGDDPGEGSDAFFTFSGDGGSDYPGDDERPGIPQEIWEHLEFMVAEKFGWGSEVLVWVSNLDRGE